MSRATSVLLVLLLISALAYGAGITLFRAQIQGDSVELEWEATSASGISGYDVYRQDYPADDFDRLISLSATAQPHYLDQNVYRTKTGSIVYRLDAHTATGLHTSYTTPAEENMMARSWDTIKLMFR
jgi:alpha-N-acetylglucosamine transferase